RFALCRAGFVLACLAPPASQFRSGFRLCRRRNAIDFFVITPQANGPASGAVNGMFKRILVANRGAIACRIIKTARKMGIEPGDVYSDADKDALHVDMADTAVAIGPPPAAESYLVIEKIVDACKQSGAEAVHPGYGFLSEREAFPKALTSAGVVFIGPNPK